MPSFLSEEKDNRSCPEGDYIDPRYEWIFLDKHFPNMVKGNVQICNWEYLRKEIPHNWYNDKRYPGIGFLSRDEAHILYNNAKKFAGMPGLEIGCFLGWSACHIACAGVELDIVDPCLGNKDIMESVSTSLRSSGVTYARLIPAHSPLAVDERARAEGKRWSFIFIDGNHDDPYPFFDAVMCEKYAADTAMVMFHDLAAPAVARGLDYFRDKGWQVRIYDTMQIMGAAWRGDVEPVPHQPDPNVRWSRPQHLSAY